MRVLLDHNIPRPLRGYLVDHMVDTANEKGWEELTNGDLLEIAERDGYQVIITGDQNLRFQQNIGRRGLGILVLTSNRRPRPHNSLPRKPVSHTQRHNTFLHL